MTPATNTTEPANVTGLGTRVISVQTERPGNGMGVVHCTAWRGPAGCVNARDNSCRPRLRCLTFSGVGTRKCTGTK